MIHVICFGNLWAGDDGFGIHVHQALSQRPLPAGVRLFDAGLLGLGALNCFEGCAKAIVVDAIQGAGEAGVVLRLRPDEVAAHYPPTLHGLGVDFLLRALPIAFEERPLPAIVIVAARIHAPHPADNTLSGPLRAALPRALEMIEQELYGNILPPE